MRLWILIACGVTLANMISVDRCLDAGGSFDYEADRCDMLSNHPHRPGVLQSPLTFAGGMVIAMMGLLLSRPRRPPSTPRRGAA